MPATDCPTVTIVTPSLNQGRFIRDTIESVLGQDYPALEYLVRDGGSGDETLDVLESYGSRLTWVSEHDRGQAAAINAGWRRGTGTILAYLNSDDVYLPGAVTTAVALLQEHPEAMAAYGEGHLIDEAGTVVGRYPTEAFSMARLAETCLICQPTVFLRREIVERVGYLDQSLRYGLDYDLWIRVGRMARFVRTPRYLAATRMHPGTKTVGERVAAHEEILDIVGRSFGHVPPSWLYAHARAVLGAWAWGRPVQDAGFVARLAEMAVRTSLRHNRDSLLAEPWRWAAWLYRECRRRRERAAPGAEAP